MGIMISTLRRGLSSRNGFVRKGAAALLCVPKWCRSWQIDDGEFAARPPVFVNSFPKSGTHLLMQVSEGLPDTVNYGAFLGSETSSFRFRKRTAESTCRFIRRFVPGEIVRGHLFFEPHFADELAMRHAIHYFIYRDPRDVVVSEAYYLREMNRWHRLHPYFRRLASIEEAIMLSIVGFDPPIAGIDYPDIAARFANYEGWLTETDCFAIRYEDLVSEQQRMLIRQMTEFYADRVSAFIDVQAIAAAMLSNIAPHKSHTFRSGKRTTWRQRFTAEHRQRFAEIAGELLLRLGYEANHDWAKTPIPSRA